MGYLSVEKLKYNTEIGGHCFFIQYRKERPNAGTINRESKGELS